MKRTGGAAVVEALVGGRDSHPSDVDLLGIDAVEDALGDLVAEVLSLVRSGQHIADVLIDDGHRELSQVLARIEECAEIEVGQGTHHRCDDSEGREPEARAAKGAVVRIGGRLG